MSIEVPGLTIVIMSSLEGVEELFVKRATNYSGRAHDSVVNDEYVHF